MNMLSLRHVLACLFLVCVSLNAEHSSFENINRSNHQVETNASNNDEKTQEVIEELQPRCLIEKENNKKRLMRKKAISQEAKRNEKLLLADEIETDPERCKAQKRCLNTNSSSFSSVYHEIWEQIDTGIDIAIRNGARFEIQQSDRYEVKTYWKQYDVIDIRPNHSWFSTYDYCIYNYNTNTEALANLSAGPFLQSEFSHRIIAINFANSEVQLSDGTIWKCSPSSSNKSIFNSLKLNQYVIVGTNDSWFSYGYNNILIIVNKAKYIAATRVR